MNFLHIILDLIIVVILAIPIIQGFRRGFVKMLLRVGKFLISCVLACLFCKKLGVWLRDRWIYRFVHEKISDLISAKAEEGATLTHIAESLPEGLEETLSTFGVDVNSVAAEVSESGANAVAEFTDRLAGYVSNIASVVLGFAILFVLFLIVTVIVGRLLNAIVTRLPIIKTLNTWLGGALGVLLGFCYAWGAAQIVVAILGLFAMVDYSGAVILGFFHGVNPLGWLLRLLVSSLYSITIL